METVTFKDTGTVSNVGSTTRNDTSKNKIDDSQLIATALSLALGSMLGYIVGRKTERVEKVLCEYIKHYGYPARVF